MVFFDAKLPYFRLIGEILLLAASLAAVFCARTVLNPQHRFPN
jgi:hypothetical protein